jgi:hypothetical protein
MDLGLIKLKYISPATPPPTYQINTRRIYELRYDDDGLYLFDGNLIQRIEDFSLITQMFYPLEYYNWFEVQKWLRSEYNINIKIFTKPKFRG